MFHFLNSIIMEFVYTKMQEHPLRNCWMVFIPKLPFVPPYFGTKKQCSKARIYAEKKAKEYFANH